MAAWSTFYDFILPEVNGVTTALVDFHLRQVAIDFCEETGLHTAEVAAINVVADQATYTLTSPVADTEPYRIKAAWFNNRPLDLAPIDILNASNPYWPSRESTKSYAFTQKQPDEIILFPKPDTALTGGLRVELILKPTLTSSGLVDWIATRYKLALAAGVKAQLMAMPDKPWTRPEFAANYASQYLKARADGRVDSNRSLTRAILSTRMRPAA